MRFLAVTDMHYCHRSDPYERRHALSPAKLRHIIDEHADDCDFIMNLGDTADAQSGCGDQAELMSEMSDILYSSGKNVYSLIGNHDTALDKRRIVDILHIPGRYYSFETDDYTCIALDANMNSPDKPFPDKEMLWAESFIDDEQLCFLKKTIDESAKDVVIFCHEVFILHSFENTDDHVIKNRDKALRIIERTGKVRAVFCGHYHYGDHVSHNGIEYITFTSMCLHEEETCALVTVEPGNICVEGFGLQKSFFIRK